MSLPQGLGRNVMYFVYEGRNENKRNQRVLVSALTSSEGEDKIDFVTEPEDIKQLFHLHLQYLCTK